MDFWFPETFTAVVIANQQNKGKGLTNFNFFFLVFELSNIYFYRTTIFFLENILILFLFYQFWTFLIWQLLFLKKPNNKNTIFFNIICFNLTNFLVQLNTVCHI